MGEFFPVFIGGAGRSGTTLVVDMLGLHPRISPIYETDFVLQLAGLLFGEHGLSLQEIRGRVIRRMDEWTRPLPFRPHSKRDYEQFHHGPHYILFDRAFALERTTELLKQVAAGRATDGFRDFVLTLFEEHCRRDGKVRWVNKTPAYVNHLPLLRALFPTMRFIHSIRDGRDTACSAVTRSWGPQNYRKAAAWWANRVKRGVAFGRKYPEQYLEVRFEDLVQNPIEHLGRMLTWLDEEGRSEEILRFYQEDGVRLDSSRIGEWRRTFSQEDNRAFWELAGEMLVHFGYNDQIPSDSMD